MATGPEDESDRTARELARTEEAGAQTEPRGDGPIPTRHSIGRFRIDAELGSGGMADVYRAYDPVLDRAVALKVLHTKRSPGDTQGMRRVLREARAAAALTHPNTVTIFEVGEAGGEVFIAMELLEGAVLREVLDRGTASLEEKLRWLLQAARALAAAHERGLVHRDVKPENMFVCADGSLKLLDFGIAKRDDENGEEDDADITGPSSLRTQAGRRLGTPRYMAPEQHAGLATDARTDEYAWGLVAFELLCGSHVVAEQPTVTIDDGAAPPGASKAMQLAELRAKVPELPEAVAQSIARALEPNKMDRFPSMDPIVLALEAASRRKHTEPSGARSPGRWWLVPFAAVAGVAAVLGLTRLRDRSAGAPVTASAAPASALAPACRTVSSRRLQIGPRDGLVVLPNGEVVIAREPSSGLKLERERDAGAKPFMRPIAPGKSFTIKELRVQGMTRDGVPSVFAVVEMEKSDAMEPHASLMVFGERGDFSATHVGGAPSGFAATTFGDTIVAVVTALTDEERSATPRGAALHVPGTPQVVPIETGTTYVPAVAATPNRLAVAYQHETETHFALFDRDLRRLGDVMKALPFGVATALAFAGDEVTLFWTDSRSSKTRLGVVTFTPGDAGFAAPRTVIDEPLVNVYPITARLPDGSFAVAWLTSNGGGSKLRVSPVGQGGALTGPSDVASDTIFRDLESTTTAAGIDFSWTDGDGGARIASVTCQPPASRPDR